MRSSACASVLAVVPALVDLTSLSSVARLAATLSHLTGIEEAAPAVLTLNIAGPRGGSCGGVQDFDSVSEGYVCSSTARLSLCVHMYLQTYRMVTGWGSVSPRMCRCRPCSC